MFNVDVTHILQLAEDARTCNASGRSLLVGPMGGALEDAVAATSGECLPQWDEWEDSINSAREQSGEHVRALRAQLAEARVLLLECLGRHYVAQKSAGRAVAILDEVLRFDPTRDGVAEILVRALKAAGDKARAADVRRRYVPRE